MERNNLGKIILLLPVLLFCAHSALAGTPLQAESGKPEWKKKMQGLYQSLTELLTDVCSNQRYYDPKNSPRIEREIKSISSLAHELKKDHKNANAADPTLQLFSGFLASEANEAYRSFRGGHKEYAREILRAMPANCIACHSRNPTGPNLPSMTLEPSAPLKLSEKASFFAATRQFDRAVDSFKKVLRGEEKTLSDPFEVEKSVREALLIAVRFNRSPVIAKSIVQAALENQDLPQFLLEDLTQWRKSIAEWESEPPRETKTEEGAHSEALRLIAQARALQKYDMDHSADIYYLRASSALYDLIQFAPHGEYVGEAYFLLGMCYEVLSPRRLENLHNIYYEACIQNSPHSEIARACYRRYERSMFFGFSGSGGTHLPETIKEKLLKLWGEAMERKGSL